MNVYTSIEDATKTAAMRRLHAALAEARTADGEMDAEPTSVSIPVRGTRVLRIAK